MATSGKHTSGAAHVQVFYIMYCLITLRVFRIVPFYLLLTLHSAESAFAFCFSLFQSL